MFSVHSLTQLFFLVKKLRASSPLLNITGVALYSPSLYYTSVIIKYAILLFNKVSMSSCIGISLLPDLLLFSRGITTGIQQFLGESQLLYLRKLSSHFGVFSGLHYKRMTIYPHLYRLYIPFGTHHMISLDLHQFFRQFS